MPNTQKALRGDDRQRAVVLVMILGILATMTVVATAFVMFMNQSYQAAANTQFAAQAEIAARSGLEHAIRVIRYSNEKLADGTWDAVTPDGVLMPDGSFADKEDLAITDPDAGWHRYFEWDAGDSGDHVQLSDPTKWVTHYYSDANSDSVNDEKYGAELFGAAQATEHLMRGRVFDISYPISPPTTRGQYAVCVVDLDGKLNARLANKEWHDFGQHGDARIVMSALAVAADGVALADADGFNAAVGQDEPSFSCLGEMARRAGASTAAVGKYRLERCFTTYPGREQAAVSYDVNQPYVPTTYDGNAATEITLSTAGQLIANAEFGRTAVFPDTASVYEIVWNTTDTVTVREDCSSLTATEMSIVPVRPPVNVNTVPEAVIRQLLEPIGGFDTNRAAALAKYLCSRRPFAGRHEFEEAVRRVSGDDALNDLPGLPEDLADPYSNHLSEGQFNNVLNNSAGTREWIAAAPWSRPFGPNDSAYDDPDEPGVYGFDGWEPYFGEGPGQTGGTGAAPNSTRSTEFKFTSRFFHIYVLGRGWNTEAGRAQGVRRLHAIYDAEADGGKGRILWLRWNLSSRGSVADIHP